MCWGLSLCIFSTLFMSSSQFFHIFVLSGMALSVFVLQASLCILFYLPHPPVCSDSLSSDCTDDFSPFLSPYWLLWPAYPTSISFPSISLSPFGPLSPHTHTLVSPWWAVSFYLLVCLFLSCFNLLLGHYQIKKSSIITVVTNCFSPPTSHLCHMTSHPAGHYGQSTS